MNGIQEVVGSIPIISTRRILRSQRLRIFFMQSLYIIREGSIKLPSLYSALSYYLKYLSRRPLNAFP